MNLHRKMGRYVSSPSGWEDILGVRAASGALLFEAWVFDQVGVTNDLDSVNGDLLSLRGLVGNEDGVSSVWEESRVVHEHVAFAIRIAEVNLFVKKRPYVKL